MAKKKMYSFAEKKHSERGLISTIMAGVSLLIFLGLGLAAYLFQGQGGVYMGAIGLTGLIFSGVGLLLGLISFSESHTIYFFSKIGAISNACVLAIWILVILIGV